MKLIYTELLQGASPTAFNFTRCGDAFGCAFAVDNKDRSKMVELPIKIIPNVTTEQQLKDIIWDFVGEIKEVYDKNSYDKVSITWIGDFASEYWKDEPFKEFLEHKKNL